MNSLLIYFLLICTASCVSAESSKTVKIGGLIRDNTDKSTSGKVQAISVSFKPTGCDISCFSPSLTKVSTQFGNHDGVGLDYLYNFINRDMVDLWITLGVLAFNKPLNFGEKVNFHLGFSFRLYGSNVLSAHIFYDHYSNGRELLNRKNVDLNIPVDIISFGIMF